MVGDVGTKPGGDVIAPREDEQHNEVSDEPEIDDDRLQEALHKWHQQDADVTDVAHILDDEAGFLIPMDGPQCQPAEEDAYDIAPLDLAAPTQAMKRSETAHVPTQAPNARKPKTQAKTEAGSEPAAIKPRPIRIITKK